MKRILSLVLCTALLCTLLPVSAAAGSAPVIAMTYTPAYGSSDGFEGQLFTEDGSSFDPSAYRISLYLQLSAGGSYWVKPTYAMPYANVNADGSFYIDYDTGGSDQNATLIHIMLIPASCTPGSSFSATRAKALDYVKITRSSSGQVTVAPERSLPDAPEANPKHSGLRADGRRLAVNVGFYTDGSAPGSKLPEALITRQLRAVSDFADTVRFFGSAGELTKAYSIAYDMGFTVIGTAWLNGNEANDKAELDALISLCNKGLVRLACVGSETLLRGDLTEQQLISDIQYVKDRLNDFSLPVTTAESVELLLEKPALRKACDILMPNCYPYWAGTSIDTAAESFVATLATLRAKAGGKEILISETGWPTAGQGIAKAKAGEAEASRYFEEIRAWSLASNIPVIWFDAADEPWKAADEGESGAHWGFMTKDMQLKDAYADTSFFRAIYGTEGFNHFKEKNHYIPGQFIDVPETMWCRDNVAAIYEYGLMLGTSATVFAPSKQITVAQAIVLACRIHDTFYGIPTTHPSKHVWYDGYVDHAVAEAMIRRTQFTDFSRPATRAEVAVILASALPHTAFAPVKASASIPDVSVNASYYDTLAMLYRAGVTAGFSGGEFRPDRTITRAEVAAIATRMVKPSLRIAA